MGKEYTILTVRTEELYSEKKKKNYTKTYVTLEGQEGEYGGFAPYGKSLLVGETIYLVLTEDTWGKSFKTFEQEQSQNRKNESASTSGSEAIALGILQARVLDLENWREGMKKFMRSKFPEDAKKEDEKLNPKDIDYPENTGEMKF